MSSPDVGGSTAGGLTQGMFARVRELFGEACLLPEDERAAFIESRTAGCTELRSAVMELLEALEQSPRTAEAAPIAGITISQAAGGDMPEMIGPYQILRTIGEGGMGIVYLAKQVNPLREVAIKIVRVGRFSAPLRARFGREIRVLGRLEHPGITRIYEAGTARTPEGDAAYFAMEYVRGERLDRAVESLALDTRARVEIVAKIADAVQHAHTKGIIHRDLKPGNILLTTGDSDIGSSVAGSSDGGRLPGLQPKILDFGVARLMDPDTQHTVVTETGLVIGTIGYMSPEQLSGDVHAIDARTDVYAIGVILYELLTGRLPHDVRGKSLAEAARIVRDEPPGSFTTAGSAGIQRIDRDLQTIVLRAIERDRDRRYPTAASLAEDLRRYLHDQPILARPPSTIYQLGKFARRNKGLVAGAGAAVLALVAGLLVSTGMFFKEQHARKHADAKDRLSTAVRGYMIDGLLMAASPERKGYDVKMLDVLKDASKGLHERFKNDPEVEANIRCDLGNVLAQIGRFDEAKAEYEAAIPLLEQTRGRDDVQTCNALTGLATVLQQLHQDEAWLKVARDALARCDRALPLDHPQRLLAVYHVGGALVTLQRYDEARGILREGLALAEKDPASAREALGGILNWLGTCEQLSGTKQDTIQIRRKLLDFTLKAYGPEHRNTLAARNNLAIGLKNNDQLKEAIEVARGIPDAIEKTYPPGHPVRADVYHMMGVLLGSDNQFEESEHYLKLAYQINSDAAKQFDWMTEQRIHGLRQLYARWPGHAEHLHGWCLHAIKARMMLAHAHEMQNLPDVINQVIKQCDSVGRQETPESLLDGVWKAKDELAPAGHARRAAFYANFVRASVNAKHTKDAAEAMGLAAESLSYATEPEVASALVAAARDMLK